MDADSALTLWPKSQVAIIGSQSVVALQMQTLSQLVSTANQNPENSIVCRDASGLESYIPAQQNPFCRRRRAMIDGGECALCCSLHCLAPANPSASAAAAVRHAAQPVPPTFQILFSSRECRRRCAPCHHESVCAVRYM